MTKKLYQHQKGFTLIEVGLFLAITGLIIVGVIATTSGQINRHRFNDTVQDFADFLMGLYSSATNVQNNRAECTDDLKNLCGRGNTAAYGYFAVFSRNGDSRNIYAYNLQGDADVTIPKDATSLLEILGNINIHLDRASQKSHTLLWDGEAQTNDKLEPHGIRAVAIVRSPLDGTLHTYLYDRAAAQMLASETTTQSQFTEIFTKNAQQQDVEFCIWSPDLGANGVRRDVRIHEKGRNSSAVEIIASDGKENRCR